MNTSINTLPNQFESSTSSELAENFKKLTLTVLGGAVVGSIGAAFAGSVGLVLGAGIGAYATWKAVSKK